MAPSGLTDTIDAASEGRLVLVVDDEKTIRLLARQALERGGFEVVLADDGESGLEAFHEHAPDVVLLDVQMPRRDGFETCRAIRESAAGRSSS